MNVIIRFNPCDLTMEIVPNSSMNDHFILERLPTVLFQILIHFFL